MTDKYAVMGNPIAHSKSPAIHAAFARQTGQDIRYEAILAPLDDFRSALKSLLDAGYKGANVTVPFKFEAFDACHMHSTRAQVAGAVNTLIFTDGQIAGDNTDGAGLVCDIQNNLGICLKDTHILILGAGGAAQGVLSALMDAAPANITVANRNVDKAHLMVQKLDIEHVVCDISVVGFDKLSRMFDVIINATSAGLSNEKLPLPNVIFGKDTLAYDMMYGRETPFMRQACENGAQVSDGLGMLVEQAAEAFYIWRGVRPQTAPVIAMLRSVN